jgi:hypothetical protein
MRKYLFLLSLFTTAVFLVVVTTYSYLWADYKILLKGVMNPNKVWFFGNSVIQHSSQCDENHESIAKMFEVMINKPVVDMSRGGMTIDRMVDITETLKSLGIKPKAVYFQIALSNDFVKSISKNSGIEAYINSNLKLIKTKVGLSTEDSKTKTSFNNKYYGNYSDFSKKYFITEKKNASCPEHLGVDQDFIAFMYWRNFLDRNEVVKIEHFERFRELKKSGIHSVLWIAPVDYEDIKTLHGVERLAEINEYRNEILKATKDLNVVDLTFDLPSSSFADRWCACGHLNEDGRNLVAVKLNKAVKNESI